MYGPGGTFWIENDPSGAASACSMTMFCAPGVLLMVFDERLIIAPGAGPPDEFSTTPETSAPYYHFGDLKIRAGLRSGSERDRLRVGDIRRAGIIHRWIALDGVDESCARRDVVVARRQSIQAERSSVVGQIARADRDHAPAAAFRANRMT